MLGTEMEETMQKLHAQAATLLARSEFVHLLGNGSVATLVNHLSNVTTIQEDNTLNLVGANNNPACELGLDAAAAGITTGCNTDAVGNDWQGCTPGTIKEAARLCTDQGGFVDGNTAEKEALANCIANHGTYGCKCPGRETTAVQGCKLKHCKGQSTTTCEADFPNYQVCYDDYCETGDRSLLEGTALLPGLTQAEDAKAMEEEIEIEANAANQETVNAQAQQKTAYEADLSGQQKKVDYFSYLRMSSKAGFQENMVE